MSAMTKARQRCWFFFHRWSEWHICATTRNGVLIDAKRCHRCGARRVATRQSVTTS